MKDGSIGDPHIYLGGKVSEVNIDEHGDLILAWFLSPTKCRSYKISDCGFPTPVGD